MSHSDRSKYHLRNTLLKHGDRYFLEDRMIMISLKQLFTHIPREFQLSTLKVNVD